MNADALLLWMSARGQGSWQQFRSAVEELHLSDDGEQLENEDVPNRHALPLYHLLRLNLQRFGHAEFFSGTAGGDWRVTPPCLVLEKHAGHATGLLIGARSANLLGRFANAATPARLEVRPLAGCPNQIRLTAPCMRVLEAAADEAGLLRQEDAPAAILSSLPAIDDTAVREISALPFGTDWRIERFSSSALGWKSALLQEASAVKFGLFRFSRRYERETLLCIRGAAFRISGQIGKYLVLKRQRQRIFQYDRSSRRLSVPASCRPPLLVERALVLCSGTLPAYEPRSTNAGILHYDEVPERIARLALALLRQEPR